MSLLQSMKLHIFGWVSKERSSERQSEIKHTTCGNIVYYLSSDVKLGDKNYISQGEILQEGYINCPHCKEDVILNWENAIADCLS